jgi:hypothetical protein
MLLLLMLVSRNIGTSVLSVVDSLACPFRLFGEFSDHAHSHTYAEEVYKADVLVSNDLDLIDVPVAREIIAELDFRKAIVQVSEAEDRRC